MQIITIDEFRGYLGSVEDASHLDIGDFHIWFGTNFDGERFVAVENTDTANVMIDEIAYPNPACSLESTGDEELDKLLAELG